MRVRRVQETQVIDQSYIWQLYENIKEKMALLDKLTSDYKDRQEEHFLRTFMHVLEKMGNQLLLAQEAYRNIDMEVKKDEQCIALASELNFFRNECLNLQKQIKQGKKELNFSQQSITIMEKELQAMRSLQQKKIKQCLQLKNQNKRLKETIQLLQAIPITNEPSKQLKKMQGKLDIQSAPKEYSMMIEQTNQALDKGMNSTNCSFRMRAKRNRNLSVLHSYQP